MSELKRIGGILKAIAEKEPWHGPSVSKTLEGLTAAQAAARPIPGAHSIWELVLHMLVWQEFTRRSVRGVACKIELSSEDDWPPVEDTSQEAWNATVELLAHSQQELRDSLRHIRDEDLQAPAAGQQYDNYFLLHGIAQHDIYHQGQIAMLKKALSAIPAG